MNLYLKIKSYFKKIIQLFSKALNQTEFDEMLLTAANSNNPYLAARCEWNFLFNDLLKAKRNWQWTAMLMIAANFILISGYIVLSLKSQYVPYIVKADTIGNTNFAGYLNQTDETHHPLFINQFIRRYIASVRQVIADPVAEKQTLDYVYATTKGSAINFINQYFKENEPFVRARNSTIEVQVNAALPKSASTWQIDWTEIERNLEGAVIKQLHYEALITVNQQPVKDPKEININPLGLYVTNLSWSQQL